MIPVPSPKHINKLVKILDIRTRLFGEHANQHRGLSHKLNISRLNHTGLGTEYANFLLKEVKPGTSWQDAARALYHANFVASEQYALEIAQEIKKRVVFPPKSPLRKRLPGVADLSKLASSSMSLLSKAQIFLVYLYCSDKTFARVLNTLHEFYDVKGSEDSILRDTIKTTLDLVIKDSGRKKPFSEKTTGLWIGKFLSALEEAQILVRLPEDQFLLHFGYVTPECWTFFALWCHAKKMDISQSPLVEAYFILPEHYPQIQKQVTDKGWITYERDKKLKTNGTKYKVITPFASVTDWLASL